MSWIEFRDAQVTILELIRRGQNDRALKVLELVIPQVRQTSDWNELAKVFVALPKTLLYGPRWAGVYTTVLVGQNHVEKLLAFCEHFSQQYGLSQTAPVLSNLAWALTATKQYPQAKQNLERAIPHLIAAPLGVAWGRLGRVRFAMGEPGWEEAFAQAKALLVGRQLGLTYLDEGGCWERAGQGSKAREIWLKALPLFKTDPQSLAWLRYNLGMSCLRELIPEAEHHFFETKRLAQHPAAAALRPKAWQGLADHYRSRGEWHLAETSYQKAIQVARQPQDRSDAYRGLGRCYRLQGKNKQALEALLAASTVGVQPILAVQVEQAATLLALGEVEHSWKVLAQTKPIRGKAAQLAHIVWAELARRSRQFAWAMEKLDRVDVQSLLAREEVRCWPDLFKLAQATGRVVPQPLKHSPQTLVEPRTPQAGPPNGGYEPWVIETREELEALR